MAGGTVFTSAPTSGGGTSYTASASGFTPPATSSMTPSTTQSPQPYQTGSGALNAPNGQPISAPAGAQQSSNGLWYVNGQAYALPPTTGASPNYATGGATLNANISTPTTQNNVVPPPAVVTSSTANTDLANKQAQTTQLNQDAQTQAATKAAAAIPPPTTEEGGTSTNDSDALDSKIGDLVDSLTQNEATITSNTNAALSPMQQMQQEAQQQLDQQASYSLGLLSQISSGTYPLSPAEQSLLASTVAQYQQVITAQQTANSAYTGQMTEAMASLGIQTSAPTQAIGMIHATIDSGNSKIAALDGQMSQAVSKLTLAFQQQDYDMVQKSWDETSKYLEERTTTLANMQKQVIDYAQQQKQDLKDQVTTNLQAIMDSNTISYQAKQQMIAQATLDEKTKDDLQKNAIAAFTAGMSGGGSGGGNGLPTVEVNSSGKPDSVSQAAFLSQFPPTVASLIKGIANYTINPSSISTSKKQSMGGFTQSQILALASQYDPNFDEKQYATRAAMQKNITSGQYSQAITAANTAMQHVQELKSNFDALGNGQLLPSVFNAGKNTFQSVGGSAKPNNFNITADAVATELSKFYKGVGAPSETEITNWRSSLSPNMSPAQFQGAVTTLMSLLGGKMSTLSDNYQQVMGQPGNFQILTDRNAQALTKMGIDPSTIDPTYGNSPTVKLSNFYGADPKNQGLIDQLIQADPSLKSDPQKMIDTLEANGISL